jgi:hypothetical protein
MASGETAKKKYKVVKVIVKRGVKKPPVFE